MENFLQFFVLLPLVGFVVTLFFNNKKEKQIAWTTCAVLGVHVVAMILFTGYWIAMDSVDLSIKHITFYKEDNVDIFIALFFDRLTAVYGLVGSFITFAVAIFSRFYLHRDSGFKRFFNTLLLFYFAYILIIFSGNFETLFMGWETLGITSFLLIIFYRDRYLPVKNGLKTISLYRLGDVALMLALWMSHHLWHENITFMQLNDVAKVAALIDTQAGYSFFLVLMLLLAAAIKSAQFPFSSWLPRAMEGPTTSSAVFYGSLSVHIGVFLMMRTYPYWEGMLYMKILIISMGVFTAFLATMIAQVQSSVKTQIAYSSIAQIGIIFIEISLGWHTLALIHFAGNAFLRTYQLLVSPSVLGYLIHDQFFKKLTIPAQPNISFFTSLSNTIYLLSIKEWHMDTFQYRFLWSPFKWLGRHLGLLSQKTVLIFLAIVYILGLAFFMNKGWLPEWLDNTLHLLFAAIGMLLIIKSFAKRTDAMMVWIMVIFSQFYLILSIASFTDTYVLSEILIYLSGLVIAAIIGIYVLSKLKRLEKNIHLNDFYGYNHNYPSHGLLFLIACLAFVGLPFTPTFIGVDLMFTHIDKNEYLLTAFTAINLLFVEIAVLRIYARLFLGPSKKNNHPIAYRSS